MTHKQEVLQNYILGRLGFGIEDFVEQYVSNLGKLAYDHRFLAATKTEIDGYKE